MKVTIRQATLQDLEKILEINYHHLNRLSAKSWDETLDETWTFSHKGRAYFTEKITHKDKCLFVSEDDTKIIGFIDGEITEVEYRTPNGYAQLCDIVVIPEHQNKSIGKQLTQTFLTWCEDKQVSYITVSVYTGNTNAIEFYRSIGFGDYGTELQMKIK